MNASTDEKIIDYSQVRLLLGYDISVTFGDGQPSRLEKRLMDKYGKHHLDTQSWEAGDIAYQCLKQLYPKGITPIEFSHTVNELHLLACNVYYPNILSLAEAGKLDIQPNGIAKMKAAWATYEWCERVMFVFDFIEDVVVPGKKNFNPFNAALPLILLQRLDEAVILECLGSSDLSNAMLEIATLRDRLQPPRHVQLAIQKLQAKLDTFAHARRKGSDVTHIEHRAMKAEVFTWLDSQAQFKSIENAATAITKQQPIAHVTGREWYKEWKKLRSASTP